MEIKTENNKTELYIMALLSANTFLSPGINKHDTNPINEVIFIILPKLS